MKTIKAKDWSEIPDDYTGIVEFENGASGWFKNGFRHREDGPAYIGSSGYRGWYLDGHCIFYTNCYFSHYIKKCIFLSKEQHPLYSTVQVWKYIDRNGIKEQIIIPGMEGFIIE